MPSLPTRFALGVRKAVGYLFFFNALALGGAEVLIKWYVVSDIIIIVHVLTGLALLGMDMTIVRIIRSIATAIVVEVPQSEDTSGPNGGSNNGNGNGGGGMASDISGDRTQADS